MTRFFAGVGIGAFVVLLLVSLWFLYGNLASSPDPSPGVLGVRDIGCGKGGGGGFGVL